MESARAAGIAEMAVLEEAITPALSRPHGVIGWLQRLLEWVTGVAVLAEIGLLLAGIVARAVFNDPIAWADEVAGMLFLWIAMLGSVIALARRGHMRLTYGLDSLRGRARGWAEALAVLAPLLFLGLIVVPAFNYAQDQAPLQTPALEWSGLVPAAALPVGITLMLAICVAQCRAQRPRDLAVVAGAIAVLAGGAWLAIPWLLDIGNWNLVIFFVGLLGLGVVSGVPIAFCFGLSVVAYLLCVTDMPLSIVVERTGAGMSNTLLLAVPLFVFLGQLIEATGMARIMVAFLASMLSHVRGGMSYVLLCAMLLVSGISGSKAADMAAVAPVLLPEMKRRGNDEGEMVALLVATGAMTETIPPSIVLIAVGSSTGVSIAALFTGGLLPGIVLALVLAVVARLRAPQERIMAPRATGRMIFRALLVALPALVLPFLIRAAVVDGIATATEASTIGIAYACLCGILVYRQFPWRRLIPMLATTAALSGSILLIIGVATCLAWSLTQSGFSHALAAAMTSVPGGKWGFLAVSVVAFAVLGSVLEGIPAMVLFGPLLFPVAMRLGIDEVHYALVAILAMGLGLFAPPFGIGYYMGCAIAEVPPERPMRSVWVYLAAIAVGLVVIACVPWITTGFL